MSWWTNRRQRQWKCVCVIVCRMSKNRASMKRNRNSQHCSDVKMLCCVPPTATTHIFIGILTPRQLSKCVEDHHNFIRSHHIRMIWMLMERINEINAAHFDCLLLLLFLLPIFKNRQQYFLIVHTNPYLYRKLFVVRYSFVVRVLANIGWLLNITIELNRIQVPSTDDNIFSGTPFAINPNQTRTFCIENWTANFRFENVSSYKCQIEYSFLFFVFSFLFYISFIFILYCALCTVCVQYMYQIQVNHFAVIHFLLLIRLNWCNRWTYTNANFRIFIRRIFPFRLHFAVRKSDVW